MSQPVSDQILAERVRRLIEEGIGQADHALIDELVAADCIEHQRGHQQGSVAAHTVATVIHRWFSGIRIAVEDVAVAGDLVWLRSRVSGTNTGSLMGFPPTGRTISIDLFDVVRMADGRVVEHWGIPDEMGMLEQLGLRPGLAANAAAAAAAAVAESSAPAPSAAVAAGAR
jgi:predicted ester cyclase